MLDAHWDFTLSEGGNAVGDGRSGNNPGLGKGKKVAPMKSLPPQ